MSVKDMLEEIDLYETDKFHRDTCTENVDGAKFADIFMVNYYDIVVLLAVNKTAAHSVSVYELAMKKTKQDGDDIMIVCFRNGSPKPAAKPLVVEGRNGWTISDFWLETRRGVDGSPELLVPVSWYSRLYNKAYELGHDLPNVGIVHAHMFDRKKYVLGQTCWHAPKKVKKHEKEVKAEVIKC